MIVTSIQLRMSEEKQKEFGQTLEWLFSPTERKTGCLDCRFYREIGQDDSIMVMEEWESEQDFLSHLRSREFAVLLGALNLTNEPNAVALKLLSKVSDLESLKAMRRNYDGLFPQEAYRGIAEETKDAG